MFFKGSVQAQTLPFTNHTEIGILQSNQGIGIASAFTLQTFNGLKINPWLNLGFTTGIDRYNIANILPLALGARAYWGNEKFLPLASLDIGLGSTLLEKKTETEWHEGGLLLNPTFGVLMKTKGKTKLSLTLGYKRQILTEYSAVLDPQQTNFNNSLPSGYHSLRAERYIFNRASIRLGVFF
ncbi:hypothetical protein IFO69_20810 [Echinicola sp. CAU 1574]|uniref:Outer membrane protein beta-barrel domain-containing protein n=1 Tax=Echinicola arenosa TaxID=2774144 RepID=A0ABR9AS74_9BACT|nr:hypothetical protein [Echinicola arenosa]MBD8491207.1 hypothetical protein [Echinicola arenosa]